MRIRPLVLSVLAVSMLSACKDSTGPAHGPPANLVILTGATQAGVFGQSVPILPSVLVTDQRNRPVPNVAVTFTLAAGGGSIGTPSATTDATGVATPGSWTLGRNFGARTLTATVANLPPVTFTATAIAPDAGILAFNLADAAADTLANSTTGQPRAHDLLSLRGDFKRDSVIVTFTFGGTVGPSGAGGNPALIGFVEFDIDDNPGTGVTPFSNSFGASAALGIDYAISLTSAGTSVTLASSSGAVTQVAAAFTGSTVVLRIPIRALGDDDGNFSLVGVIGTVDRPTDVFPNSGATIVRPSAGAANLRMRTLTGTPKAAAWPSRLSPDWHR